MKLSHSYGNYWVIYPLSVSETTLRTFNVASKCFPRGVRFVHYSACMLIYYVLIKLNDVLNFLLRVMKFVSSEKNVLH